MVRAMTIVGILTLTLALLAPTLVFSFSHRQTNEVLTTMQRLTNALDVYRRGTAGNSYPPDIGVLATVFRREPWADQLIPGALSVVVHNHIFFYTPEVTEEQSRIERFMFSVRPLRPGGPPGGGFITDEGGTLYQDSGVTPGIIDSGDRPLNWPQLLMPAQQS